MRKKKAIIISILLVTLIISTSGVKAAEESQLVFNASCTGRLKGVKVKIGLNDFYEKYSTKERAVKMARKKAAQEIIKKSKEILRKKRDELSFWGRIAEAQKIGPIEALELQLTKYSFSKGRKSLLSRSRPAIVMKANICFK